MILKTKLLQDNCKKILDAVDTSTTFVVAETLELKGEGQSLYLNVTNKEYFVSVKSTLDTEIVGFHAVVDAKLFLNLISKITTEDIELTTTDKVLIIKANGNYKIPLIYDEEGKLVVLPKIEINNVTNDFVINNGVLQSISKYNSKELLKSGCVRPVQKLFYVDEQGALTFTNGACVNNFKLEQPITLYLTEKIVKLFKLFSSDVHFYIGQDSTDNETFVTKIAFSDGKTSLVSILNMDTTLTSTFPVTAIRNLAGESYSHTITIDKSLLLDSINRLALFTTRNDLSYTYITFSKDGVTVFDSTKDNHEVIKYKGDAIALEEDYVAMFNTLDLKLTLETCEEQFINLSFGNHRAVVIARGNIKNIVPECRQ